MHDLSFFRNNFDRIAERLAARSNAPNLDRFRELDRERRAAISRTEQLKAQRNAESVEIGNPDELCPSGCDHLGCGGFSSD